VVVTQFGRVEFDPLRVPLVARSADEAGASFADRLDRMAQSVRDDAAQADGIHDDAPASDVDEEPVATEERTDLPRDDAQQDELEARDESADAFATDETATPVVAQNELPSRESAVRHEGAGKGAVDPLEASPRRNAVASDPASPTAIGATVVLSAGKQPTGGTTTAIDGVTAAQKSAAVTRSALDRLHSELPQTAQRALAAEAKQTGYRTLNAQAVQLNEQARDSVFKQILFKLGKDGGEMRMRLEPPELGQLDLRMTVENGNTVRLSIGAERADLRDLLLSGLDELKKQLEQSGLSVAHAEVHTQHGGGSKHGDEHADHSHSTASGEGDVDTSASPSARTGWITAQGLDFWV
jgi:flagellar hook-length control protein FliK